MHSCLKKCKLLWLSFNFTIPSNPLSLLCMWFINTEMLQYHLLDTNIYFHYSKQCVLCVLEIILTPEKKPPLTPHPTNPHVHMQRSCPDYALQSLIALCACVSPALSADSSGTLNKNFSIAFSIIGMFSSHAVSNLSIFFCAEITPTVIR